MKIAILSRSRTLYSTRVLAQAARKRGHKIHVVDYLRLHMDITSREPRIYLGKRELADYDAIIPRIGAQHTFFGTAVVRQFEMMGVFSLNESVAISRARDKLRCLQLLARRGIGLPVTAFAHDPEAARELIDICGGAPLIIKLLEGTQGVGVVLAETEKAAESVIEAFRGLDAHILAQEFIAESGGSDLRAFVVGDEVVAAMKRQAAKAERYVKLREEMVTHLRLLLAGKYKTLEREASKAAIEMTQAASSFETLGGELRTKEAEYTALQQTCYAHEEGLTAQRKELAELQIEAERTRGRLNSQSQQVQSIEQRLAGGENESQEVEKRLAALEADVERHRLSLEEASANANDARDRLRSKNEEREQLQGQLRMREQGLEQARQQGAAGKPAAAAPASTAPISPPAAAAATGGRPLSKLELARMQGAAGSAKAPAAAAPAAPPASAPPPAPAKAAAPAAGGKPLSKLELARQQGAVGSGGAGSTAPTSGAAPVAPAPVPSPAASASSDAKPIPKTGPDGKPLSKLELARLQGPFKG